MSNNALLTTGANEANFPDIIKQMIADSRGIPSTTNASPSEADAFSRTPYVRYEQDF